MGNKDIAEKILESFNDVFADIVNGLLFHGEEIIQPKDLVDQAPRSAYKADGKVREIERDVAKRWLKGDIRIACLGAENQTFIDPDIVLRIYGYDGAEYRWQLTKANNGSRYPVVTMVLYFGMKHWDKPLTLYEAVNVPDIFKPYVPNVRVNLFEIAYLTPEDVKKFRSDFRIVADYFVQKRMTGDYKPSPEKLNHIQETLHMLSVMANDHRFEEVFQEAQEKGAVNNMCDVLERIEQKGRNEGESRLAALMLKLKELGRIDDAFRAASDPAFRAKLYKELSIV